MTKRIQQSREMGFGRTEKSQTRLINRDGSYNFERKGLSWRETFRFYHFLIGASLGRFILSIFLFYLCANLLFTGLYFAFCADSLAGMIYNTPLEKFGEVYFFSAQTLTTVGYGRINPTGFAASSIASLEALVGLMSFAVFTGLIYARFSKPKPSLMFSEKAVVAPYRDITALMFRVANKYNSNLMNMNAQITFSVIEKNEQGVENRNFYGAKLERSTITFLPSSWTIVHPIDEESLFFGVDSEKFKTLQPEIMILMNGFDESFNQVVHMRQSYALEDMFWGAKFSKIFSTDDKRGVAVVDLGNLSTFEPVSIDALVGKKTADPELSNL
jgi:inward rectifier potassium channel